MTLKTHPNPTTQDYMVTREVTLGDAVLRIHYVPHKDVLDEHSLDHYITSLGSSQSPEILAHLVFEACLNELVPFWLRLRLIKDGHVVMHEECAPDWENKHLIDTVTRYDVSC